VAFLWKGKKEAYGRHCMVNWLTVGRPIHLGGLGVLDLVPLGVALQVHRLWL
jgi:hypothetical protein